MRCSIRVILATATFVIPITLAWLVSSSAHICRADIYQWEWIDPNDHSLGRQQSSTLCPDGAGHKAVPGAYLCGINLTMAWMYNANLYDADFRYTTLIDADLSQANLTESHFSNAKLTGADFTGAIVGGASFESTTDSGFTATQFYSTTSYQTGDLREIGLAENDLTGWNFLGKILIGASFGGATMTNINLSQVDLTNVEFWNTTLTGANLSQANLTEADFSSATLTSANLSQANLRDSNFRHARLTDVILAGAGVRGASFSSTTDSGFTANQLYSTASYQAGDLSGINLGENDLCGWNFSRKNLKDAGFSKSAMNLTDITGAEVHGANFSYTTNSGFTANQLYSTASYQAGNLTGIGLDGNDLTGWNFSGKSLIDASFRKATMTNANLSQTNLTNVEFWNTTLIDANLSQANLTDANFRYATLNSTDFTGAKICRTNFSYTTDSGFTATQLFSTASYQAGDLTGLGLAGNDLTGWNFAGQNLATAQFWNTTLIDANFSRADLTDADFTYSRLSGTDFTGADIRGADFRSTTIYGFTASQIYSTASYQAGNLTGIGLYGNDLTGWEFSGMNLNEADFRYATLIGSEFTDSDVRGADFAATTSSGFTEDQLYSTASYQVRDLTGIKLRGNDLTGWNFTGKRLIDADFSWSTLNDADFSGSEVCGVNFSSTTSRGFTAAQLYSTASYQGRNLSEIVLVGNVIVGWDFSEQNLAGANFSSIQTFDDEEFTILNNTVFIGANLTDTIFGLFWDGAYGSGHVPQSIANLLTQADTRGALGLLLTPDIPETRNTIFPKGTVYGLNIGPGESMRLWDYDPEKPLPIEVHENMQIEADGNLRIVIEDDVWGSTLIFEDGIDVLLNGTLELLIDPDEEATLASLVGVTFDLFDWTCVTPTGQFAAITTGTGLVWDTSNLYTTGQVTLMAVPEPSSIAILLTLTTLALARCRRRGSC